MLNNHQALRRAIYLLMSDASDILVASTDPVEQEANEQAIRATIRCLAERCDATRRDAGPDPRFDSYGLRVENE